MQTYRNYAEDCNLGFGISNPNPACPTVWMANDSGGSDIVFIATDETLEAIKEAIASDAQCGPDDDDSGGSDEGLTSFWNHVEAVVRQHGCKVFETTQQAVAAQEAAR